MGKYLKYADLDFQDWVEERTLYIIQRVIATLTMNVYVNPKLDNVCKKKEKANAYSPH